MITKIEVTRDHIKKGIRANGSSCPIAIALIPLLKASHYPVVYTGYVSFTVPNRWHSINLNMPGEATIFLNDFDKGLNVDPFTFELDIPDWILRERANLEFYASCLHALLGPDSIK